MTTGEKTNVDQLLANASGTRLGKKIEKEFKQYEKKFKLTESIDILSLPPEKLRELQFIRLAKENCLLYAELLEPEEEDEKQNKEEYTKKVKADITEFFDLQIELVKTQGMNEYINALDQYSRLQALINTEIEEYKYKQI